MLRSDSWGHAECYGAIVGARRMLRSDSGGTPNAMKV